MLLSGLVAFAMSGQMVPGQRVLWTHTGTQGSSAIYANSALIGDVDGDGWRDVVHSVEGYYASPPRYEWEIWTFSGRDGSRLRTRQNPLAPGYSPRCLGSTGDVDGDGVADYAVGWWDQGCCRRPSTVEVRSGRDDILLWQATNTWGSLFGFCVAGIGDVDGDGRPDVGVTAPRESTSPGATAP